MKADDDTYVAVDNLREFLSKYDPNEPHFFGLPVEEITNPTFSQVESFNGPAALDHGRVAGRATSSVALL